MKRIVKYLLFLAILSQFNVSCATQRKCLQKFPPDTVRVTTTVYRDTIVPVYIPRTDTVYKYGHLTDTIFAISGSAGAKVYIVRDTIKLFVWQNDTTLQVKLDSVIKEIKVKETEIHTIKEKTRLEKILWQVIGIVSIIFLSLLLIKVKKR